MQFRTLGQTGLRVPTVAMGCWGIAGGRTWGEQDQADSLAAIRAAHDAGITLFDTSPAYGDSESLLGQALAGRARGRYLLATKINQEDLAPADVAASCEASLRRLRTDYVDLLQIHWPNHEVPFADTWGAMQRLREQGKARHLGVGNFGPADLAEAAAVGRPATNQVAYSLLLRAIEFDILPFCRAHRISILAYSPLAQGLLSGRFRAPEDVPAGRARTRHFSSARPQTRHGQGGCERQTFEAIAGIGTIARRLGLPMATLALAWCLHQAGVGAVLAGARRPEHVPDVARAADVQLDAATLAELDRVTAPVKALLGPDADPWAGASRMR